MTGVAASISQFVENQDYVGFRGLQKYASIQGNVENGLKVRNLQNELSAIVKNVEAIHSIFLLFDDADYVISSDRGVVELIDYFSLTWMRSTPTERRGGVWVARELRSATLRNISVRSDTETYEPVLSYLYSLNRLTTAVGGTIVANVSESFIAGSLNYDQSRDDAYGTMLIQRNGMVISHPDTGKALAQSRNFPHIAEILDNGEDLGYAFFNDDGKETLYTWLKSNYSEWVYISLQSMEHLSRRASLTSRSMTFLAALVLVAGTAASVVILSWISRPMRRFISSLREDTVLLAVQSALSGDKTSGHEIELLGQIFPNPVFIAVVAALDNYREYRYRTNTELKAHHRYLFLSAAESLCKAPLYLRGAPYGEGQIAIIFNVPETGQETDALLEKLRDKAVSIFGTTVTIGLSGPCFDIRDIHTCTHQAAEAVLSRMTGGNNRIYHSEPPREQARFFYPQNAEGKILNYLDKNKLPLIAAELDAIQQTILSTPNISNDHVRFIYNQLAGATIKHLTEMEINTSRLFSNRGNIYSAISSCDTLDEIRQVMAAFFQDILEYLNQDTKEDKELPATILRYFEAHFKEDTFFEDMAAELGISYSYMRRVVREATGKSVLDNINLLRIREAKDLLLGAGESLAEIAGKVGYRNTQSLNRYFKKYEGLSPTEFRIAGGGGRKA
jgi:AraC-like DNA-binding protein